MGNTSSKPGGKKLKHLHFKSKSKEPEEKKPQKNSKLIKTEQRLGSSEQEIREQKPLLPANSVPKAPGNRVGSETSNQSESARQAVARAAEERYKKNQDKLAGSKERLQAKKNLSKLDKNLWRETFIGV